MYNDILNYSSFNLLAVILYLFQDYYEYGSYVNNKDIVEKNGSGHILWNKTINDNFAIIKNNKPYYSILYTKKRVNNDFDYFKRLHECILTRCSKELENSDILDLFDLTYINISDEDLSNFGEKEYILKQIEKELKIQFNTRKQLLLKTIYAYISNNKTLNDIDSISMFGSNSYNLIWEKVCAEVMNDQLKNSLNKLLLPKPLNNIYNKNKQLISLIDKPIWHNENKEIFSTDTLIPDIISIEKIKGEICFIIFDAKYYKINFTKSKIQGQPGIEDITKQYLYQLAYKKFINDHEINKVFNCFLFPTNGKRIVNNSYVKLEMLNKLGLKNIRIIMLPATLMYENYLHNKKLDLNLLNLKE